MVDAADTRDIGHMACTSLNRLAVIVCSLHCVTDYTSAIMYSLYAENNVSQNIGGVSGACKLEGGVTRVRVSSHIPQQSLKEIPTLFIINVYSVCIF